MEGVVGGAMNTFWKGKSVFITGHTGFKGAWLSIWLHAMGAKITGFALDPPTEPSLFRLAGLDRLIDSFKGDVRDGGRLQQVLVQAKPEIVFHLAALPIVRESYLMPVETYATNVMGTVNLLEAVRWVPSIRAVVNVTSDKCYKNVDNDHAFREDERLGGYDPYSNSKACSELVTASWRSSFFNPEKYAEHRVAIATARAGNVIGGGDWATDRLIPDCIRALLDGKPVRIRNPHAVRPWQHVLEPLSGYLMLAQRLYEDGCDFGSDWNFGPFGDDAKPVRWIVETLCEKWGGAVGYEIDSGAHPHETGYLRLDIGKAQTLLGWQPCWNLETALDAIVDWMQVWWSGGDVLARSLAQIERNETDRKRQAHSVDADVGREMPSLMEA